jgi:methyl-accepting chemotaxis protein
MLLGTGTTPRSVIVAPSSIARLLQALCGSPAFACVAGALAWAAGQRVGGPWAALAAACLAALAMRFATANLKKPARQSADAAGAVAPTPDGEAADEVREHDARDRIRQALQGMADKVEAVVRGSVQEVVAGTDRLRCIADEVANAAAFSGETIVNAGMAADASVEAAAHLADLAARMEATVARIADRREDVMRTAQTAVLAGDSARDAMTSLSKRLDAVLVAVGRISGIARQTNLLAINATIEAVRAGDFGSGFAVVAAEVKSLAQQTATLTREVTSIIDDTRSVGACAGARMDDMQARLADIEATARQIGEAVEEHRDATRQVGESVRQAGEASASLSDLVSKLTTGVGEELERSAQVFCNTKEIGDGLATLLEAFETALIRGVRTALPEVSRRARPRYPVTEEQSARLGVAVECGGTRSPATLIDISDTSASLQADDLPEGAVSLHVHIGGRVLAARIVTRRTAQGRLRMGVVFTGATLDAATLSGQPPIAEAA